MEFLQQKSRENSALAFFIEVAISQIIPPNKLECKFTFFIKLVKYYISFNSFSISSTVFFASPNSILVLSLKNKGF